MRRPFRIPALIIGSRGIGRVVRVRGEAVIEARDGGDVVVWIAEDGGEGGEEGGGGGEGVAEGAAVDVD